MDFGGQPLWHSFVKEDGPQPTFDFAWGACGACGLAQLVRPSPLVPAPPAFPWARYQEPKGHMKTVAERFARFWGAGREAKVLAMGPNDEPLLEELKAAGFRRIERLDWAGDCGVSHPLAGTGMMQAKLTADWAAKFTAARGKVDVIAARYLLEHFQDLRGALAALRSCLNEGGCLIAEVPDCRKAMEAFDAPMLWEEHVSYFEEGSFRRAFQANGFGLGEFLRLPYPLEDGLVAFARPAAGAAGDPGEAPEAAASRAARYAARFAEVKAGAETFFRRFVREKGKVAVWGAGHRTVNFVNYFELGKFIECAVDDSPEKQGLRLPGSLVPVRGSEALGRPDVSLCLLGVGPAAEEAILKKNAAFVERGGIFSSLSPTGHRPWPELFS